MLTPVLDYFFDNQLEIKTYFENIGDYNAQKAAITDFVYPSIKSAPGYSSLKSDRFENFKSNLLDYISVQIEAYKINENQHY